MTITTATTNKIAEDFNVYFTSLLQAWSGKKIFKAKESHRHINSPRISFETFAGSTLKIGSK